MSFKVVQEIYLQVLDQYPLLRYLKRILKLMVQSTNQMHEYRQQCDASL